MVNFVEPSAGLSTYTCPYCHTLSTHRRNPVLIDRQNRNGPEQTSHTRNKCAACNKVSFWIDGELTPRPPSSALPPCEGMPDDVLALYREAGAIADISPRSASALLRTALEVLVQNHLGRNGKLNDAIGDLVKDGLLDDELQQAMDVLRLVGNGAVHPKEIRLDDTKGEATAYFELLNIVVERLIVRPQRLNNLYAALPESKRNQIEQRDS